MSNVFFLGATGYIGGSVLVSLLKAHPDLKINALVRSADRLEAVRAAGATPIQGSHDDLDTITELSSQADIVINSADADNLNVVKAILEGIKKRFAAAKGKGIYIHTSGAANFLAGNPDGSFVKDAKVWDDSKEEDIKGITTSMVHGSVDVHLLEAGKEDFVDIFTICPSTVYGPGTGPGARQSLFFRLVIPPSIQQKAATYIGVGTGELHGVHINDLTDLYDRVFDLAVSGQDKAGPYGRYYIANVTGATWKDVAVVFGRVLHAKGLVEGPEPRSVSFESVGPFAIFLSGTFSVRAERAKSLGWVPKETGPLAGIFEQEIDLYLATNPN